MQSTRHGQFVRWLLGTALLALLPSSRHPSSSGSDTAPVDWLGLCMSFGQSTIVDNTTCMQLNRLEALAGATTKLSDPDVSAYEQALAEWRQLDLAEQPHCRLEWLGSWLNQQAEILPQWSPSLSGWEVMVHLLQANMLDGIFARCIAAWYVHRDYPPQLFTWPDWEYTNQAEILLASPDYDSTLAVAGHLAPRFGAPQVQIKAGGLRAKRAINLLHWRNILGVFPGLRMEGLSQVFEFGGGTGDFVAMLRDLGYNGTHFVYDLPPVLLFTQYWLRYSGLAAYQGWKLLPEPDAVRNKTVLEVSADTNASFDRLDTALLNSSLFVAFESLSESPVEVRIRMVPWLKRFGFIIMSYEAEFDGVPNNIFAEALKSELSATHDVMIWDSGHGRGGGGPHGFWKYFAAAAQGLGGVVCGPQSRCNEEVLYTLTTRVDA